MRFHTQNILYRLIFVLTISIVVPFTVSGCISPANNAANQTVYDLGPVDYEQTTTVSKGLNGDMVIIPAIRTHGVLTGNTIVYRLVYAQLYEPRTYTQSRWAAEPTEMIRQQLQQVIGKKYPVTLTAELYEDADWVLWISLEEFSQNFTAVDRSESIVQLRCTLRYGNGVIGQKVFSARVPTESADASGAVKAFSTGVEQISLELFTWLDTLMSQYKK